MNIQFQVTLEDMRQIYEHRLLHSEDGKRHIYILYVFMQSIFIAASAFVGMVWERGDAGVYCFALLNVVYYLSGGRQRLVRAEITRLKDKAPLPIDIRVELQEQGIVVERGADRHFYAWSGINEIGLDNNVVWIRQGAVDILTIPVSKWAEPCSCEDFVNKARMLQVRCKQLGESIVKSPPNSQS